MSHRGVGRHGRHCSQGERQRWACVALVLTLKMEMDVWEWLTERKEQGAEATSGRSPPLSSPTTTPC